MKVAHQCGMWTRSFLLDVFGTTGQPTGLDGLPAVAAAVAGWLRVVADEPVVLVGHSTGAQAALHAAARVPEAVRALILMSPTFPPRLRRAPALLHAHLRNAAHEPLDVWRVVLPGCARVGAVTVFRLLRSAQRDRPEETITEVRCPVLVVRGEHDAFCPNSWANGVSATTGLGRCVNVSGAHGFPHQYAKRTSALIADFAQECR